MDAPLITRKARNRIFVMLSSATTYGEASVAFTMARRLDLLALYVPWKSVRSVSDNVGPHGLPTGKPVTAPECDMVAAWDKR